MRKIFYFSALCCCLLSCKNTTQKPDNGMAEVQVDPKLNNRDIIRSPVTMAQPIDTNNVAKMTFSVNEIDFGTINEGQIIKKVFKFTNTGKVPLVITSATSSCGCTVPTFRKDPIPVGASDEIVVQFNSKDKENHITKVVDITANTVPSVTKIAIKGNIIKSKN
jgi:hypothetical protein